MQNDILRLFGAPNDCLILIIIYYIFKYSVGIKTTLLESLRNQKKYFKSHISVKHKDLVFARNDFFGLVRAPNESLRLIIIYYMFKYTFGNKKTLVESHRSQKGPLIARFRQNYLYRLSFCASWVFKVFGAPNKSLTVIIMYYFFKYTFGRKKTLLDSHQSQKAF